jgi:hypothetical protein
MATPATAITVSGIVLFIIVLSPLFIQFGPDHRSARLFPYRRSSLERFSRLDTLHLVAHSGLPAHLAGFSRCLVLHRASAEVRETPRQPLLVEGI